MRCFARACQGRNLGMPQAACARRGGVLLLSNTFYASALRRQLPSQKEARRTTFGRETWAWLDRLQEQATELAQRFQDISGYSEIERLKQRIAESEEHTQQLRHQFDAQRKLYMDAQAARTGSQREVNELLLRKHEWSGDDLERFTRLYRDDHAIEQRVEKAAKEADEIESALERARVETTQLIGARYREEQIWSDRIRQTSTWGTMIIMAVNVLLFLVVQLGVEPWKRKRLVSSFEDKVRTALADAGIPGAGVAEPGQEAPQPVSEPQLRAQPASQSSNDAGHPGPDAANSADSADVGLVSGPYSGPSSSRAPDVSQLPLEGTPHQHDVLSDVQLHLNTGWRWLNYKTIILTPLEAAGIALLTCWCGFLVGSCR